MELDFTTRIKLGIEKNLKKLGQGSSAEVFEVVGDDNQLYTLRKQNYCANEDELDKEWEATQNIRKENCPFVIKYIERCIKGEFIYLKLEHTNFDNLQKRMNNHGLGNSDFTKRIMLQILNGVAVLHKYKIVHRNLNGRKILLQRDGMSICAKITDFRLARTIANPVDASTICGSDKYTAPEILLGQGYGLSADIWSLGILFFQLLTGNHPFPGNEGNKLVHIPPLDRQNLSPLFDGSGMDPWWDLLGSMLAIDPIKRPTAQECIEMPIFKPLQDLSAADLIVGTLLPPELASPEDEDKEKTTEKARSDKWYVKVWNWLLRIVGL